MYQVKFVYMLNNTALSLLCHLFEGFCKSVREMLGKTTV